MKDTTLLAASRIPWPNPGLQAAEVRRIIETAGRLKAAARAGRPVRALLGKNLAQVYSVQPVADGSVLQRAGSALGARMSNVQFGDARTAGDKGLKELARMLGRLYDAVDCGTLADTVAAQIERHAGIPVFRGLDQDDQPASVLADVLSIDECCAQSPSPERLIAFESRAPTARGDAFVAFAGLMGFECLMSNATRREASPAPFRVDATDACRWALHGPGGRIDEGERAENHRFVLQAILIGTVTNLS